MCGDNKHHDWLVGEKDDNVESCSKIDKWIVYLSHLKSKHFGLVMRK